MMGFIFRRRRVVRQASRFGLVGVMNTAVDFSVFFACLKALHWSVVLAQTLAYSFGIFNSFFWNRRITFKRKGRVSIKEVSRFLILNVMTYLVSIVVLGWLSHSDKPLLLAKVLVSSIILILNFTGNRMWVFDNKPTEANV